MKLKTSHDISAYEKNLITFDYARVRLTMSHDDACAHVADMYQCHADTVGLLVFDGAQTELC